MPSNVLRLLSFAALAAVLPLIGLYVVLIIMSTPNATGGLEPIVATVCYTAFTCIFGALIIVAINFSRQLGREAKGQHQLP